MSRTMGSRVASCYPLPIGHWERGGGGQINLYRTIYNCCQLGISSYDVSIIFAIVFENTCIFWYPVCRIFTKCLQNVQRNAVMSVTGSWILPRSIPKSSSLSEERGDSPGEEWAYVTVRPQAHMFYWLYKHPSSTKVPLIVWLQVGLRTIK